MPRGAATIRGAISRIAQPSREIALQTQIASGAIRSQYKGWLLAAVYPCGRVRNVAESTGMAEDATVDSSATFVGT